MTTLTPFGPSVSPAGGIPLSSGAAPAQSRGAEATWRSVKDEGDRATAGVSSSGTGRAQPETPAAPGARIAEAATRSAVPNLPALPDPPAVSEADASFAASARAAASLRDTLASLGIDSGAATFLPRADLVSTPFGAYWNRQIEVRLPDGRWEMFSADLVQRSPEVAAVEFQSLFTIPG